MVIGNILLMNWYYQSRIKLDMKYFWKDIFKLIPAIIVSIVIGAFAARIIVVNTIMHFIMVGFIYVIAYSLLMYCIRD